MNMAKLRDQLAEYFNSSELHNLCFDLGIKHERIAGDTIDDKARELVAYCLRHGKFSELVNRCKELRPHLDWSNFTEEEDKVISQKTNRPQPTIDPAIETPRPPSQIHVTGIVVEEVTQPKNDGSRGSALYRVPLQLSHKPSHQWAELFVTTWNHPPQFTTMHRHGIAKVLGDKIILNGTTMKEIEDYHLDTLELVINKVNEISLDQQLHQQKQAEELARQQEDHTAAVTTISQRINAKLNKASTMPALMLRA